MLTTTGSGPASGRAGDEGSYRLERRRMPRYGTSGPAVADFGETDEGHIIAGVELIDSSASGLGFLSPTPVEIGRRVRIFLGQSPVPGRSGRVARCREVLDTEGCHRGYRIGLDTGLARAA